MSGHSHAKTVKRLKEADAKKRGQIFSKVARLISVAIKEGGPNPESNSKLKMAIETARSWNVPNENIERAIKREEGGVEKENLEEIIFEAYGPGGITIIVEGITDNKNRALGEIKQVLNQYNGKIVEPGAVKWMYERKGCITLQISDQDKSQIKNREDLELIAIEAGAEDIYWQDDTLEVYTKADKLENVKKKLEEKGIKVDSISLDWKPKEMVTLKESQKEQCLKLFDALDDLDSVQEIYSNLKL